MSRPASLTVRPSQAIDVSAGLPVHNGEASTSIACGARRSERTKPMITVAEGYEVSETPAASFAKSRLTSRIEEGRKAGAA